MKKGLHARVTCVMVLLMQKFASGNLGSTLRALRHEQGLTVEGLARKSDVSVRTIMSIEHDRTNPRVDIVQRLADGLGIPVADLFPTEASA